MSAEDYRDRLRVRACGLLIQNNTILLVQIQSPVTDELVWMPPGGGVEFGERLEDCLRREFEEETGLCIEVGTLQFVNELIEPPFHAVELYYRVSQTGGSLKLGKDPEHDKSSQLIKEIKWMPVEELAKLSLSPPRIVSYLKSQIM